MKPHLLKLLIAFVFMLSASALFGTLKFVRDSIGFDKHGAIVCKNTKTKNAFVPENMRLCPKP